MVDADELIERRFVELLGLGRWGVGVNSLRTPSGEAAVWVDHLWTLWVWPSFDRWWYLAGVAATPRAKALTLGRVAWLPVTDVVPAEGRATPLGVAADLTADSFIDAMNAMRLIGPSPSSGTLDGIAYSDWFESCEVSGRLRFPPISMARIIIKLRTAVGVSGR